MEKITYIPVIDELSSFILNRARAFKKRRLLKNKNIHSSVRIGNDSLIDKNVYISEGTYIGAGAQLYSGDKSKVEIGKFCAIGYNVFIKECINIASHAIIAANSVVVEDVKEREIVGGFSATYKV